MFVNKTKSPAKNIPPIIRKNKPKSQKQQAESVNFGSADDCSAIFQNKFHLEKLVN